MEVYSPYFQTTLTAAIVSTSRPITFTVAATSTPLGVGSAGFSILIYDVGWDGTPSTAVAHHVEAIQVTSGGSTTTWTGTVETGWTAMTHANGSIVVATVLTPRSMTQQMTDHTTTATVPDPHSLYLKKSEFTAKGDLIVGTGAGTFAKQTIGANGTVPVADSTQTSGIRWGSAAVAILTHMGDLIIGGLLGVAQRLAAGTVGQALVMANNTPAVTDPGSGPTVTAGSSGGSLTNGAVYDFAYAWETSDAPPDGGITLPSPITTFTVTSSGRASVQCPAAPASNLTLRVYANTHSSALQLQASITNAATGGTNTVVISSIAAGAAPATVNTTGGTSPAWGTVGSVTSVAVSAPSEFSITGSPVTGSGTISISKGSQSAHALYAGPASGSATAPTFRAADPGDFPFVAVSGGTHGQLLEILALTEVTTIAASATTTTTIQIPAGSIVLSVNVRVTVAIPTAATFTVVGNGSSTAFNTAAVSTAANSTDPGTAAGAYYNASAQTIKITPNSTPGAATGMVRVTIFYIKITPPTS